ncbi:immunoglobulin-like domain-containing protein [Listeria goaensis]|uniref:immunoglobulin-like domain-containing protein n=1 Tax=Listeria goaensis TaxID=1649188 RepID=UPI000B592EE9|nr:immunoglobulin-like domain-containing protein [Listeria goaensis]
MTSKKSKLRKLSISAVLSTVIASTILTTVPYNAVAIEANQEVVGNQVVKNVNAAIGTTTIWGGATTKSTIAKGFAEPGSAITVTNNGVQIGTGRADFEGGYRISIAEQAANTVMTVTATKDGNTSSADATVVYTDRIPFETYPVTPNSNVISGTATPGADIVISVNDSENQIASGTVNTNGTFAFVIPKQAAGTKIKISLAYREIVNNQSTIALSVDSIIVKEADLAFTTINKLTTDSTRVEGTAEPNTIISIKNQSGTQLAVGSVGSDGRYNLAIPKQLEGTIITATVTAKGQTESASTTVVRERMAPTTIEAITTDSVRAEGTAEPNADIELKNQSGIILARGKVATDGYYSLTIPKQTEGTIITATATVSGKTESASTTVKRESIAPTTIKSLTTDSVRAEGTAEPNADIELKNQSGVVLARGRVASDGVYVLTIQKQAANTVIIATATANGKTSSASTTVVQTQTSTGTVSVKKDYLVGVDSRIQAEVTGDVTKVYLEVDGVRKSTIPVASSFEYYAKNVITHVNQDVYLVGLNASNEQLARTKVTLKDGQIRTGTVSPKNFIVGADAYVKGTYTGDIKKVGLSVNGTVLYSIPVATDGSFQYYARPNITNANTDQVYVIGYNSEGNEVSRVKVTLSGTNSELDGTITAYNYILNQDKYVVGTYTGNVKYITLRVNGTILSRIPVVDGNYTYYARPQITSTTDVVSVLAYNNAGSLIAESPVAVR